MSCRPALIRGLLLGYLAGCNPVSPPSPVRLEGDPADIRRLAGTWQGEFLSNETARIGKIFLELRAESDTAYGKITFNRVVPITTCSDMSRPQAPTSVVVPVVLRLGGLATSGRGVGGWIRPYRDPDLACWMDTWFEGRLRRDTLRGTFYSRRTDIDTVRAGTWWAARVN
jgi:hypothetical protein